MKKSFFALATAVVLIFATGYSQKFEGLALTPPMGWNSWNKFGCDVNEQMIRGIADGMAASGMKRIPHRGVCPNRAEPRVVAPIVFQIVDAPLCVGERILVFMAATSGSSAARLLACT